MERPSGYDIFFSYATLDNQPFAGRDGWVDTFRKLLEVRVSQLIGEHVRTWMDRDVLFDQRFGASREAALDESVTMVCIVSPAYIKSEFCLREFRTFASRHSAVLVPSADERTTSRMRWFKVMKYPVPFSEQPRELDDVVGYQFFETVYPSGHVQELWPERNSPQATQYFRLLDQLAYDLTVTLSAARRSDSGAIRLPAEGSATPTPENTERRLAVFLCHSSGDKSRIRALCDKLEREGLDPWLDERKLLPGQKWAEEIPRAVRGSDVVVICLSKAAINKRGYLQKEITSALDVAEEQPDGAIFLIPARLEDCEVPQRLQPYHWVNLYEDTGYELLMRALQARASSLNVKLARTS